MASITITANGELIDIVITDLPGNDDKTVSLDTPPTFGIDDDIPYIVMKDNDGSTIFGADNTIAQSFTNINGPVTINDVYELRDAITGALPAGDHDTVRLQLVPAETPDGVITAFTFTVPAGWGGTIADHNIAVYSDYAISQVAIRLMADPLLTEYTVAGNVITFSNPPPTYAFIDLFRVF